MTTFLVLVAGAAEEALVSPNNVLNKKTDSDVGFFCRYYDRLSSLQWDNLQNVAVSFGRLIMCILGVS